ncbi:hypothetical protein SESBI_39991 [Sesbania bispinosa]|nr:hypothetical protein SESBI_39991 [Sesbania bispinosa]
MDQREFHLHPLGICYRLYHFITKTLALHALKTVTLGRSPHYNEDDDNKELPPTHGSSPAQQAEEKNNPCRNVDGVAGENMALPKAGLSQATSLKKTVSISENVEEILPSKKIKKKRSKLSFQKSSSMDQEEEEEPKPLRSILKVGSDLKDKSNSIC